jgi:hypothetical protein
MKRNEYEVEQVKGVEYIIVECPNGHRNRAQKAGDQKISFELTCAVPKCSQPWMQLLPFIGHLEAVEK